MGAGVGKWASKGLGDVVIQGFNVVSPVAKGAIAGALGGAAGGYAGSFVAGAIATGSLKDAHQAGLSGLALGAGIGALSGGAAGYKAAKSQGINPWTGKELNKPLYDGLIKNTKTETNLQPGQKIDRYGEDGGRYTSPQGTPFGGKVFTFISD